VLELGTAYGESAMAMAKTADLVHCVDHFRGDKHFGERDTLRAFLDNTRSIRNIIVHIGAFEDVLPVFRPQTFGLVFLDGYHTYEQARWDIELAESLVAGNGWFAFHDYTIKNTDFGVGRAVDERFGGPDRVIETLAMVEVG